MSDETKNDDKEQNFAKLREQKDKLVEENKKLRGLASQGIVAQAGLDPKDPVVTLVREKWESGIEDLDDLNPESFTEFAGSFNLIATDSDDGVETDDDDDFSAQLEAAQAKSDKAKAGLKAPQSKDRDGRIAEHEQNGDFSASFQEKIASLPSYL